MCVDVGGGCSYLRLDVVALLLDQADVLALKPVDINGLVPL
jgi:hypothetical protein